MPMPKKDGDRRRFNGFILTDTERDRVVANWIDSQPNAAESIKALIYAVATGRAIHGAGMVSVEELDTPPPKVNRDDPRVKALAALDT